MPRQSTTGIVAHALVRAASPLMGTRFSAYVNLTRRPCDIGMMQIVPLTFFKLM
jgi:hypothetical protein